MGIKGTSQTLFVRKEDASIITFLGNKKKIIYNDLKRIDYFYPTKMEVGYIEFISNDNKITRFEFNKTANEKISRTIEIIKESSTEINICEHEIAELKFYQRTLFTTIITFVLGFPLGLIGIFLAWRYKKGTSFWRGFLTVFAIVFWGAWGYVSYIEYKSSMNSVNEAMAEYQDTINGIIQSENQVEVPQTTDTTLTESLENSESSVDEVYNVGDVYESKEIKIMYLNNGDYSVENEYSQPESGNKYIFVEFSIENVGNSDCSAGYASFRCYADNTECSNPILSSEGAMPIITSLSPGRNTKGKIFYEVPTTAEKIEIEYETNILTQEKIYFNYK